MPANYCPAQSFRHVCGDTDIIFPTPLLDPLLLFQKGQQESNVLIRQMSIIVRRTGRLSRQGRRNLFVRHERCWPSAAQQLFKDFHAFAPMHLLARPRRFEHDNQNEGPAAHRSL